MKKTLACAMIFGGLVMSTAAFADKPATTPPTPPANTTTPNRSSCGAAHAAAANVNGNFGFLGAVGGTPGYHNGATGQEPGATGYNNSHTSCQPS
jgi:hypothetical protein